MRIAKSTLKVLFGLAHLAFFVLITQFDWFKDNFDNLIVYLPLGTTLFLSMILGAFGGIVLVYILGLLLSTVVPAISCFTVGRLRIIYAIFVIIPHIINTHFAVIMADNSPVAALVSLLYLVIAVLIAILPG